MVYHFMAGGANDASDDFWILKVSAGDFTKSVLKETINLFSRQNYLLQENSRRE